MTDPWLWEEADVQALIANGVQESLTLDYKRCGSLEKNKERKDEVSKDVSAFANSAGGIILYGVEEDKHLPTGIDVGFDPRVISKEWIEQVINSTIQRRIDGIRIKEVPLSGPKAGKAIYVVSIPQSHNAPHMANDNRYYKRFNFESVRMDDYEVRDVSRRLQVPKFRLTVEQEASRERESGGNNQSTLHGNTFKLRIENIGRVSARDVWILLKTDPKAQLEVLPCFTLNWIGNNETGSACTRPLHPSESIFCAGGVFLYMAPGMPTSNRAIPAPAQLSYEANDGIPEPVDNSLK